jgi:DNA-binding Lrp family transcriptional regulator
MSIFKYKIQIRTDMDVVDFQIIADLFKDPFASMQDIGNELGISETSIRKRLKSLSGNPTRFAMHLIPSPFYFKRKAVSFIFENKEFNKTIKEELLKIADVVFIWSDHNRNIIITAYLKGETADITHELEKLMGIKSQIIKPGLFSVAGGSGSISRIEWKVIYHLIENPRITSTSISRRTGLSRKTVMKYRTKMLDQKILLPVYSGDFSNSGSMIFGLIVQFRSQGTKIRFSNKKLLEAVSFSNSRGAYYIGFSESVAEFEDLMKTLGKMPEVENFTLSVPTGGIVAVSRIKDWVSDEINVSGSSLFPDAEYSANVPDRS